MTAGDRAAPQEPSALARLEANVASARSRIAAACARAGRDPAAVELLPIVKYVEPEIVRLLYACGLRAVGESTVQEARRKIEALASDRLEGLRWHLVGHLQRNKAGKAIESFAAIHSLDSQRLAEELNRRLAASGAPGPQLYVEVNVSGEEQKGGLDAGELRAFLSWVQTQPRLAPALVGLMAMAPLSGGDAAARAAFRGLRELRDRAMAAGLLPANAGLSMGMSGDFEIAIEEGATLVRLGSALFEGLPQRPRGA
jgi:hypothetical protein